MDIGHWHCDFELDPLKFEGFVYCITHIESGKLYVGKKSFHSRTSKKVKGKINRKHTKKESNWREYSGSSDELNADILAQGKDKFSFKILQQCKMKGLLNQAEALSQIKFCLNEDYKIHDRTYNKQIILRIRK